ncbi:two-component sensor histidine kinase [Microbacterium sorbitolivorans]|uniref:Sensor histidine kinase MtrB n=1 Tax=Microbacterium sorbitolivorans TaxID=1867410 RepID=A0A367XWM5_9MICO|nr:MtrAB system histidine kinase MtrB [Microbacterium sorbitolivorans]RCK57201.1 sensor histidine kinase [Microbacterium sorbitolivorans]GGF45816.1 two-component sensor histidine kinase [Microbacterium sorbitolivorans]
MTGTLGGRLLSLVRRPMRAWRHSLLFRTVAIAAGATTLAIVIATVWATLAIQSDLFNARKDQILADTKRAVDFTQSAVYRQTAPTDRAAVQQMRNSMTSNLATASSTELILGLPIRGASTSDAPASFTLYGSQLVESMLTDGLREQVRSRPETQWYQSIALPGEDGRPVPAIVVGQQLEMPNVGVYEVYLAYPLNDVAETVRFVQGALWVMGAALVVIVGGIVWLVMRSVATPVAGVSRASARLAAGDLAARLDVVGENELATLALAFNRMADSLESQIRELAELSLVQQRFVSDVSHELRTPLTTIRLAAGVLYGDREEFDPVTARSAELLYDQVGRFEVLLADLLEISRYDAGSVELSLEEISMSDVTEQVAESLRQVAWEHDTELRFTGAVGDDVIPLDPRRVRRILRNLVGNAIEHGERHPIEITVAQNETAVSVGVRDRGLGMRPEHASRVFDRFWRADPSRKRTLGGSGLGLAIALGDAKLHGGTIEVWSELGVGTHFVVTLPRGEHDEIDPPIRTVPPEQIEAADGSAAGSPTRETLVVRHEPEEDA